MLIYKTKVKGIYKNKYSKNIKKGVSRYEKYELLGRRYVLKKKKKIRFCI